MLRKIILYIVLSLSLITAGYFSFIYYVPYSEGVRSGELIKISHKGFLVKTWEGELSQGISGAQIFAFSIMDNETTVIEELKQNQGKKVTLEYEERYKTFFWWGDTRYFITKVTIEK
ncbi:6-phosphogluconate dehydrogenase [Flavobacterium lacisediminis]|uniref:6-phosphogluconate dehydrogenase n=1 Tax=Flavobacterium lacisediminis TaxID=2989705 RepID=A0ABT3EG41_9FLAO|nr:6-phosphogluconate dehydrogenase [Flavobacterium lacisediminis]MCW1147527.1 6-phosphogluconate dehydrogenase [Flavobacterium lacisediminis]